MIRHIEPRHRWLEVERSIRAKRYYVGDDPWMEALLRLFMQQPDVPDDVIRAAEIYYNDYKRECVEALLLAGADGDVVFQTVDIPGSVVNVFRHLCFDTEVFYDRLDRIAYAYNYPGHILDGHAKELKKHAVDSGLEYLRVILSGGRYHVSPTAVVREAINQAYCIGKAGGRQALGSQESRDARAWMTSALKGIAALPDLSVIDRDIAQESISTKLEIRRRELVTQARDVDGVEISPDDIIIDVEDDDGAK